ncbi:unnamed protein product, partial [Ectocarpus sp. 6 AP-2014]
VGTTAEAEAVGLEEWTKYCEDTSATKRRTSRTVWAGKVPIGSEHRIARQTMTTTNTNDVDATVAQARARSVIKCADAGADLVRITVQGKREAKSCKLIREKLNELGYDVPLVADIHFQPKVAMDVAEVFEKIRINPGNFVDGRKTFEEYVYDSKEEFDADLIPIEASFKPLVLKCKELGRAMRIGTNHGSLSARVLSYYGDTPRGMVESAVEFANICRKYDFHNFVFSMKASNPLVMVQAYRLLAAEQYRRGWDYPLHLGVTEAGEGEDGRMKSAIGIGALLMDGLGDTIRVSLTEDPEFELSPCAELAEIGKRATSDTAGHAAVPAFEETTRDFQSFERRTGALPEQQETDPVDVRGYLHRDGSVMMPISVEDLQNPQALYQVLGFKTAVGMPFKDIATTDSVYLEQVPATDDKNARTTLRRMQEAGVGVLAPLAALEANPIANAVAVVSLEDVAKSGGQVNLPEGAIRLAVEIEGTEDLSVLSNISPKPMVGLLNVPAGVSRVHASRRVFQHLADAKNDLAIIHLASFPDASEMTQDKFILSVGAQVGGCLVDGLGDGVMVQAPGLDVGMLRSVCFGLLQGCRMRNTKTEYVSCPSCGRTLFDLQEVTAQIAEKTGHLPGVAIAIMGCIVNGVGEMADADFGYVGGAPGKVDLYVGKEMVQKGIPNEEACDALIDLIKENGRWVDKEPAEEEVVAA